MKLAGITATNLEKATSATPSAWVRFDPYPCQGLSVTNNTGTELRYRRKESGVYHPVPDGGSHLVVGINDAAQVEWQRSDGLGTQVTIYAVALSA